MERYDQLYRLYEEFVTSTDELVFDRGGAAEMLRTAFAMNKLAGLD